jgi:ABC-type multidrug transport system fused ATPase/permease subunit
MPGIMEYMMAYAKENKGLVTAYTLLLALTTVLALVGITKATAALYQAAVKNNRSRAVVFLAVIIGLTIAVTLVQWGVDYIENIMGPSFKQYTMNAVIGSIFKANSTRYLDVIPMRYRAFVRVSADASREIFNNCIKVYLPNIILCIVLLIFLFVLHWSYGVVFLVGGCVVTCFFVFNQPAVLYNSREVEMRMRYSDFFTFDVLQAMSTVISANTVEQEKLNISRALDYGTRSYIWMNQNFTNFNYMLNSIMMVMVFIVMFLAARKLGTPDVDVDKIVTALSLMSTLRVRMATLSATNLAVIEQVGRYRANALPAVHDTVPSTGVALICDAACGLGAQPKEQEQEQEQEQADGAGRKVRLAEACALRVEFDKVTFRYPDTERDVICDFSWSIGPGVNCLRAKSGAGKSTLAKLLVALHPVTEGDIRINGKSVADISRADLRCHITFTNQDQNILNRSIGDVMRYGTKATDQQVAAVWARIRPVFEGRELDDRVGKMGSACSTGMRQILRLANVELRGSKCVVADEPCSGLDAKNKANVLASLKALAATGTTLLIITHDEEVAALSTNTMELVRSCGAREAKQKAQKEAAATEARHAKLLQTV